MSRILLGAVVTLVTPILVLAAAEKPAPPPTDKKPIADTYHGVQVTEDYRWLEKADDAAVKKWTAAQNLYTRSMLDPLPALPAIRARVKELLSATSPDYTSLDYQGGKLFALKSEPPKEQPFLITLEAPDPATARVILDPNKLNPKGTTAIDFYVPSLDGRLVAVSLSEGGSEEGTLHVYETATGKKLPDVIPRVQFPTGGGSVAWNADGTGFYYTRYPRGNERPKEDMNFYEQVYFHKLGTPTENDEYILGKELPRIAEIWLDSSPSNGRANSAAGAYVLVTVQKGDGGEFEHFLIPHGLRFSTSGSFVGVGRRGELIQVTGFRDKVTAVGFDPRGGLLAVSQKNAPRGNMLRLSGRKFANTETMVPESEVTIQGFRWGTSRFYSNFLSTTDERLYTVGMVGGPSRIRVFDWEGRPQKGVPTPPISSIGQLLAWRRHEILFRSETFIDPPAWYRFDPSDGEVLKTDLFRTSPADFSDCEVVRELATSKDGTKVPLNLIKKKGTELDGKNPTILYGYGGYGSSQVPRFNVIRKVWLEQGGVYAIANLRGGGEFGEEWHRAGNLTKKQNVFDDFIACAQYLVDKKYTNSDKLAIMGGSNGGLLMGAVLTQRPELFRAVVSFVGIYDMLRVELHPNGAFNVTEFGSVKDPDQFKALYAYSPYHRVKDGTAYPAVFLLTGENDGRVDPHNSRKMTARLQAATSSSRPVLLRTSSSAGHGIGSSLSEQIAENADVFAFLFHELGVEYKEPRKDTQGRQE